MSRRHVQILSPLFLVPLLCSFLLIVFAVPASAQTWQLVWSDEFNGTKGSAPNSQFWAFDQGLPPDGGQNYNCTFGQTTNGCDPTNPNVYLDGNGNLAIVARQAAGAPNGITSGRIRTASGTNDTPVLFSTKYGRIEAGVTLPVNAGNQGVWPAFWMLGTNISTINWPSCGEIDILEYIGKRNPNLIYGTLHGQGYANTGIGDQASNSAGWGGYHIVGVIWSPNQVQFYVDSVTNIYATFTADQIMASQPWVNGGLAAWPFNNPFFIILNLNMGGPFPGNVDSTTTYPQTYLIDYVRVYQSAAPAAPTNVSATATSSSQVSLNWTASTSTNVTYNIYRSVKSGFQPLSQTDPNADVPLPNQNLIATNLTSTSFTDTNLASGQTYYYVVTATGSYSSEAAAGQAAVTTPAAGVGSNGGAVHVSAAGYAGTGAYVPNSFVSGGFTNAFPNPVDVSAIANPAPQDVYHSERWGPQSWVIGHLTPGGSYNLLMHFAETAFAAAGQRQFNVLVNGQQVLTNFDIFAAAGQQNKAIVQTINTTADQNGAILLQLAPGAADQPEIRALDVVPSTGGVGYGGAGGSTTYIAIDSGGPVEGNFQADLDGGSFGLPLNALTAGGGTNTTTQTISTTGVSNPAPAAVYQTERYGAFGYVFTGLLPKTSYTLRLHMAEGVTAYNAAGDRLFNVRVNGAQVLTDYDIFANAGAQDQAVIKQLSATSDEHGIVSVQFSPGTNDAASLRGIEITQSSSTGGTIQINSGGGATGTWVADTDVSGGATSSTTAAINTSNVASPAPQAVYQTERFGTFTYTIPNLTANSSYTVNLHFAEIYWNAAGKRLFNVTINGSPVLTNFDVFAAAGGENIAIVKSFPATASATGQITIQFTNGSADQAKVSGIELIPGSSGTGTDAEFFVNSGGPATGTWAADEDFTGGTESSTASSINTANVTNPAPQAVYQSERYGSFTYTIPGISSGTHTVRLHFAEFYWTAAGQRVFNVSINGTPVLTNFDIIAAAGAKDTAVVEQFTATPNTSGQIVIQFAPGSADNPKVSGIEIH